MTTQTSTTAASLGEDYLKAKRILLMRRKRSVLNGEAIRLDEAADNKAKFDSQVDLVANEKMPVPVLFDEYKSKISSRDTINKTENVNSLKILSEADDEAYQNSIKQ